MLFVSLSRPPTQKDLENVHGVELRLDLFLKRDISFVQDILSTIHIPVMLTIRNGKEEQILECLQCKPAFFDLEYDRQENFLLETINNHPDTKFILSYHNFTQTPQDLEGIYVSMKRVRAFGYKIACFTNSTNDALRMLLFSKQHADLSAICMGEKGEFARVLGPVVENLIDYACASDAEKTAPGQLSVSEMMGIYRYCSLNSETALYGLIGCPVAQSRGHLYHNHGPNLVYVKMNVQAGELGCFFPLAEQLGFRGLSVTMPLKEVVIPRHAINTLRFDHGQWIGCNTDGKGALDAIGPVKDKCVVLLGAGGAARAIALEAIARGAIVWIFNRNRERGNLLADVLGCHAGLPSHYDILINCTPQGDATAIQPGSVVMDIVYTPRETEFLQKARLKGCKVIYGEEMFFNQAALQREFWFDSSRQGDFEGCTVLRASNDCCR